MAECTTRRSKREENTEFIGNIVFLSMGTQKVTTSHEQYGKVKILKNFRRKFLHILESLDYL